MQNLCTKIYNEICDNFETQKGFRKDALVRRPVVFLLCNLGSWPRGFGYTDVPRQNHERVKVVGPDWGNYGQRNRKIWERNIYTIEMRNYSNDFTFQSNHIPSEINPLKALLRKDGLET